MAPEYALMGHLTEKADVYSFGVVAMEIVSGKSNTTQKGSDDNAPLIKWVTVQLSALSFAFFCPRFYSLIYDSFDNKFNIHLRP